MPTRVKYDGIAEGCSTFLYTENTAKTDGDGKYHLTGQPRVNPGDIVEVEDLNDPNSERARLVRDHVARGVAHVVEEKAPKKSAVKESPAG